MRKWLKRILKAIGILLLVVLVLAIFVPLLFPVPPLQDISTAEALADPDSKFIQVSDLKVHYKDIGQGKNNIILLHGFGASTYSWREVIQPLSKNSRVIAYDRPAFGLTERPLTWQGLNPYGVEGNARLLIRLMDGMGIDKAVLAGNSAGGTLAVYMALNYPSRVQALVLVDPALGSGGMAFPAWLKPLLNTPQAGWFGQLFVRQISSWGMDLLIRAWADPTKITEKIKSNYRKPLNMPNWDRGLWKLTLSNEPLNLAGRLNELKIPVQVVTGDSDTIVPTESTVRLAGQIPGARLTIFNRCGHVPQEECPEAFLAALNAFLITLSP